MFSCSMNQNLLIPDVSWPVTPKCDAYFLEGQTTQTRSWTLSKKASHLGVTGWVMMFYCSMNQTLLIPDVSWHVTPKCDAYVLEGQTTQTRSWTLSTKASHLGVTGWVMIFYCSMNKTFLITVLSWPVTPRCDAYFLQGQTTLSEVV